LAEASAPETVSGPERAAGGIRREGEKRPAGAGRRAAGRPASRPRVGLWYAGHPSLQGPGRLRPRRPPGAREDLDACGRKAIARRRRVGDNARW